MNYDEDGLALLFTYMAKEKEKRANPFGHNRKEPFNKLKNLDEWDLTVFTESIDYSKIEDLNLLSRNFDRLKITDEKKLALLDNEFKYSNFIESIHNDNERLMRAWVGIEDRPLTKQVMLSAAKELSPDGAKIRNKKVFLAGDGKVQYTPPEGARRLHSKVDKLLKFDFKGIDKWVIPILFHIQYELIHPLSDGNGRTGRLFFQKQFIDNVGLPCPLLLSESLYSVKREYYKAVNNPVFLVDWKDSINFFLNILEDVIIDTLNFIESD